jgi:thymidylate synthase (FAD)
MHHAKLVWITPDAEKLVGKIARVSNPANEENPNVERLLKYLITNKHWSPFEMASMCVEVITTRAISAQILRHRSFSFQEFSQRYADPTEMLSPEIPDLRRQDTKNRQNSIDDIALETQKYYHNKIAQHFDDSLKLYESMLHSGIAKECARSILPLNMGTRLYMSGTLRSWLHYIDLRSDNGTQKEHQTIARSIGEILDTECPTIARAMWS